MHLGGIVHSEYNNVVAIESDGHENAVLFIREGDSVSRQDIPFRPFLLLQSAGLLKDSGLNAELSDLNGDGSFVCLAEFTDMKSYLDAIQYLKQSTGRNPSAPDAPYRLISDTYQQIAIALRLRSFRKMGFNDIRRMQFDIETLCTEGFDFPNPERENDKIIIITMSDNTGWEQVLSLDNMDEKELLKKFVEIIRERDPDVLEGHNIFRFDLPYIETRAKRHRVKLNLGRDGSVIQKRNSRLSAAERTINYTRYDIFGRNIIDTYHLALFYDISHRDLESYGLKDIARHFGVAAPNRTYIDGQDITSSWFNDRENLLKYALDDVRETRSISEILSPSSFFQAQLIPFKYQDCVVRGNATKVDAMLVAEYINAGQSLPQPENARQFSGGLTKSFHAGIFKNVWHCDIRSLYPSIILAEKLCPKRDTLKAFPRLLEQLRAFRLSAKDAEKSAKDHAEKDYYNALQTTFKILINSFYGYVGFFQGTFNDFQMAEKIAARGREILTSMLNFLEENGAKVIEMDTDGIYFQPADENISPEQMETKIQSILPEGIEVELDATYPVMFGYKSKNYALLGQDGEVSVTGAALKSRGLEPFQRDIIHQLVSLLLQDKPAEAEELFGNYRTALQDHSLPLDKIAKTETLSDSLDSYSKKMETGKSRRSASYELAIASGRDYRRGDQVAFYVIGDKKRVSVVENSKLLADAGNERDENVAYYLDKLDELYKKFKDFIPPARNQSEFNF